MALLNDKQMLQNRIYFDYEIGGSFKMDLKSRSVFSSIIFFHFPLQYEDKKFLFSN